MTRTDQVIVRQCMERFCRRHREDRTALPIAREHVTKAATRLIRMRHRRGRADRWNGTIDIAARRWLDSAYTTDALMMLMGLVPETRTASLAMAN